MAKSLVYKATADDAKEPTGFQLKELAQLSYTSLSASTDLVELLLKRLEKDSADVKYKALKCIKYMCLHGRTEFRMDIQRDAGAIKNALHFRGNPDPLRGDAANQRVRDEAKECMNAVFNGPSKTQSSATGRIEGYGGGGESTQGSPTSEFSGGSSRNHGYGEGTFSPGERDYPTAGGSGSGKMVGFGNPQYDNSKGRSSPTFLQKMKSKMNDVPTGPYKTYDRPGSTFQPPPIASIDATRKRGEVGGDWANGDSGSASSATGSFGPSRSAPQGGGAYATHVPAPVRPTSSNGEYETRLIDSLTPSVGVRTQPSKEELSKFASQCESLDKLLVVRIINDSKLPSDQHANTQMKALCLIEAILTTGDARSTEEVEDYLCENPGNLEWIESSGANLPLRNKAIRVMELCGLREEKKAPQPTATATSQSSAANSSFYTQQQHQPLQQATPVKAEVDLLGFASPPPPAVISPTSSAFGFLEPQPVQASVVNGNGAQQSGGDGLFGSMEIRAPQQQVAQTNLLPHHQPPQRSQPQPSSNDAFDLFNTGSSSNAPAPTGQSQSSSNSLDFLNSNAPVASSSSSGKVDPLTLLMSTAKISSQPRALMAMQPPPVQFGANGMAGFPPRQNMPQLGPPSYPGQHGPFGGNPYPPQGYPNGYGAPVYPPHGYPPHGQASGFSGGGYPVGQPPLGSGVPFGNSAANSNALFQVKAAGSGAQPIGLRPSIDLDPLGNPILLGPTPSSTQSGLNSSPSAFGFVGSGGDQFEFVNDMMKK